MLNVQRTLHRWTPREYPEPGYGITATHAAADIGPDTDVPWELLVLDPYLLAIRAVEQAARCAGSSDNGVVPLNFPALDSGHVETK